MTCGFELPCEQSCGVVGRSPVSASATELRLDGLYNDQRLLAEQARIASDVRGAEERLAAVDAHLAEWQEILETAMRFATSCAKAYARASEPTWRRFNQAVFTRIEVRDGKIADVGYHPPFDLLLSSSEFEYGDLVEAMGIEPTNLLHAMQRRAVGS